MDFSAVWPYAVAAVLLLALTIMVLLIVLLRKSARAARMGEKPEPPPLDEPLQDEPEPELAASGSLRAVFRRAARLLAKSADDPHEVPLYLLAGVEHSRPSDLLARAGLELQYGDPFESGLSLGHGRGFWFFGSGVVLDAAGPQLLGADGRSPEGRGWTALVRQIQRLRPKRPLDGVVITLAARELLEAAASDAARIELGARMGRVHRRFVELQQTLGFRLPAYILVTSCERLPGFSALCESLPAPARQEMLGWSNPAQLDAAYRGEAIAEAFEGLGRRLEDLQMEVFAGEPRNAGELLQLPGAVRSLAGPLRSALDPLFRSSSFQGSLMLRGIYLSGRAAEAEDAQIAGRGAFLFDFFERKVFAESGIAAPSSRIVSARHRAVRIAQVATVTAAVVFAVGLGFAWARFRAANHSLQAILEETYDDMRAVRRAESELAPQVDLGPSATRLLTRMAGVNLNHYHSLFVPASWVSPFESELEDALRVAFEELILRAMRRRMEEKARQIIADASTRIVPARSVERADAAADPPVVENISEFRQLQRFLAELRRLEQHGMLYNGLAQQRGSLDDLGALVSYTFDQQLPKEFYRRSELYRTALRRAADEPFRPEQLQPAARPTALQLVNRIYEQLFARNAFAGRLQQFSLSLQTLVAEPPPKGETERFLELAGQMRELEAALSRPGMEWAFRRSFDLGRPFTAALAEMERSPFLGPELAASVRDSGTANWAGFRRLLTYPAPVIGPIVAAPNGEPEMQLSADAVLLKSGLDTFLGQPFVTTAVQGRRLTTTVTPDRRLVWDPLLLEQSLVVARAHDRFRENALRLFPAELRTSIDAVARERAWARMWDLLCAAQQFAPVPPMTEEELRNELAAFTASQQPLSDALDGFTRLGYEEPRREAAYAMTAEAARLLQIIDRLLEAEHAYRPRHGNFAWWDGSTPLSPAAWDARDGMELEAYLDATRLRLTTLARGYAQPLVAFVTRAGTADRAEVRPLVAKWQGIADDLRDYEAKKPGNAVLALQDYMSNALAKVRPAECTASGLPAGFRGGRGFFSTTLQELSRDASARCYALGGRDAQARWTELAQFFNQRLAGRYPFADAPPSADAVEADPADVRAFFRLFDSAQATLRATPKEGAFAPAHRFVDEMTAVRAFFAPFLDTPKGEAAPALDIEATFRILRDREIEADQIIGWSLTVGDVTVTNRDKAKKVRWTAGTPVRLALRWANDAPRAPFLRAPRRGASVRERTVVFEYGNRWSLLTALAENRPRAEQLPSYADVQPVTLALSVDTRPAAAEAEAAQLSQSQVFLRLALLAPGTTQSIEVPRFPVRAPRLAEEGGA